MKPKLSVPFSAAVLALLSTPLLAQMTGVSHPEDLDDTQPTLTQDGSHYIPPGQASASASVPVPTPVSASAGQSPAVPPASPATPTLYQRVPQYQQTPVSTTTASTAPSAVADPDAEIVTSVPVGPNELPIGTKLNATLQQPISTQTTQRGSRFAAQLTTDVSYNGVVLLPAGSIVYGVVSRIHGGRAMEGPAAIRLQPNSVALPDGTVYPLKADVTGLDHYTASHVDPEGTIVANTHPGQTAAAVGLTTTSAVVAGAVIGGGVGALVGLGVGAGAVTVWWIKHDRHQELPTGTAMVFTLDTPLHLYPAAAQVRQGAQ
ncbi:MAG: hypothetical protein ACP5E5_00945 [Acidobacteriaceae bacterium]